MSHGDYLIAVSENKQQIRFYSKDGELGTIDSPQFAEQFFAIWLSENSSFQGMTPELKLETFFNGPLVAHGMVQNRSGKVTQRFTATMEGTWDGNEGVLDELFYWDDGREEQRVWYLTKTADNTYQGQAGDVIGIAEGTTAGNALNWVYQLEIETGGRTLKVTLDDWMYLLDEDRMINRTRMTYFGFHVGDITLYIERLEQDGV